MFDTNPNTIQLPRVTTPTTSSPIPLVLIHDGGGTIFNYLMLGSLSRPVFGIANPNFLSGASWRGGLSEMARHYADFVRSAVPRGGPVILGGWSLGGLLSLEVAALLARRGGAVDGDTTPLVPGSDLHVLGIILIDTVYPIAHQPPGGPIVVQNVSQWIKTPDLETRIAVTRCFADAFRMIKTWGPPQWGEDEEATMECERDQGRNTPTTVAHRPPPVVLLRAGDPVPVPVNRISRVDLFRQDRLLGWGKCGKDLIVRIRDIPGHHFNIFASPHLDVITEELRNACFEIERAGGNRDKYGAGIANEHGHGGWWKRDHSV